MIRFILSFNLLAFIFSNTVNAQEAIPGAVYQGMAGAGSAYDGTRNFMFNPGINVLEEGSVVSMGSSVPVDLTDLSQFYAGGLFDVGGGKIGGFLNSRGLGEFNRVNFGANVGFKIFKNTSVFLESSAWLGNMRSDGTRPMEITTRLGLTSRFRNLTLTAMVWNPLTYNPEGALYIFRGASAGFGYWFDEHFWVGLDFFLIESYPAAYNLDTRFNTKVGMAYKFDDFVTMFAGYDIAENVWGVGGSLEIMDWAVQFGASNQPILGFIPEIGLVHAF